MVEMGHESGEGKWRLFWGDLGLFNVNGLELNTNIPFSMKKAN
jgi:hypothetical protein